MGNSDCLDRTRRVRPTLEQLESRSVPSVADVTVTVTDGLAQMSDGSSTTYTIRVLNRGSEAVTHAVVANDFPSSPINFVNWSAQVSGGASVTQGSGAGDFVIGADLPVGGTVTITAHLFVYPRTSGTLVNTVSVALAPGDTDPNSNNNTATDTTRVGHARIPDVNGSTLRRFATGSAVGGLVNVYDTGSPTPTAVFAPFPGFTGGVAVAVGDVNGDQIGDLAAVVASGGPTFVRVFDGVTGAERLTFLVLGAGDTGGASIALGDTDRDGKAEIVVGLSAWLPAVGIFDGMTGALRVGFLAYPEAPPGLIGVRVATGDLDGNGRAEVITTPTAIAPLVRAFDADGNMVSNFFAFSPAIAAVGATVGEGDLDGDGAAEILVGVNALGGNYVLTFNGGGGLRGILPLPASPPTTISRFGPPVGAADVNGDGAEDMLVTVGPVLGAFDGRSLSLLSVGFPYPGFSGGVYVG